MIHAPFPGLNRLKELPHELIPNGA